MVCLDTSFVIDVLKGRSQVEQIEDDLYKQGYRTAIASPSIAEIIRSLYLKSTEHNMSEGEKERVDLLFSKLAILPLNKESATKAGEIQAELINKGEDIGITDIMIAAIAIHNNETLLTKNQKHFARIPDLKIRSY